MKITTSQNCKTDYFTCSFGRKINFLKCGDNEGPVATFLATLVRGRDRGLDTADIDPMTPLTRCVIHILLCLYYGNKD